MHFAKGPEFRAVAVAACYDEVIPLQIRIERIGDDADLRVGLYLFIGGSSDDHDASVSAAIGPCPPEHGIPVACARLRPAMAKTAAFFEQPVLNSPYEYPSRHWELDATGQPTNKILPERRKVAFITPIPKPKKQKGIQQETILFDAAAQVLGTEAQQYDLSAFIGGVRHQVDRWRELPDRNAWNVTPETARLLTHWRSHRFGDIRPFFCQVEAVETAIWLTEVAPTLGKEGRRFLDQIDAASEGGQSGPRAAGAQTRHGRRQDHRPWR